MKTAYSAIIGSTLISNALGTSPAKHFIEFGACPTEDDVSTSTNIISYNCTTIPLVEKQCDCLMTGTRPPTQSSFDEEITCDAICYFKQPMIGDPCPSEEKRNPGWSVLDCPATDDLKVNDCLVEEFLSTEEMFFADPRQRLLNIRCGRAGSLTPAPSAAPPSCGNGGYAYDNKEYCKCPAPVVVGDQSEVSVCGDATYLLPKTVQPCSGPDSADPTGTGCPKKGDVALKHCREEILSYLTGAKSGNCEAPEDATCEKLGSGAWGCVFPGNCNTVNTCMEKPKCEGEYIKDAAGQCVLNDNGYPEMTADNTAAIKTDKLAPLTEDVVLKGPGSGASAVAVTSLALVATMAMASIFA